MSVETETQTGSNGAPEMEAPPELIVLQRGEDYVVTESLVISEEDHRDSCLNSKTKNPAHIQHRILIGKYVEMRVVEEIEQFVMRTNIGEGVAFATVGGSCLYFSEGYCILRAGDSLRVTVRLVDFNRPRGLITNFYVEVWKKRRLAAYGLLFGRGVYRDDTKAETG